MKLRKIAQMKTLLVSGRNLDSDTDEEGEVRERDTDENIVGVRKTVKSIYTYVDFNSDTDMMMIFSLKLKKLINNN